MNENKNVRDNWLNIRISKDELKTINDHFKSTTSPQLSSYARNVLLKKPVVVKYRNTTADDVLAELILLRKELNAIGNNFNQAVKKLHIIKDIPEMNVWIILHENMHRSFLKKTDEINEAILNLSRKW
jgi:hypothetical protein